MENVEAFLPVEVTIQEMESYDGAPGDTWFLGPPQAMNGVYFCT